MTELERLQRENAELQKVCKSIALDLLRAEAKLAAAEAALTEAENNIACIANDTTGWIYRVATEALAAIDAAKTKVKAGE